MRGRASTELRWLCMEDAIAIALLAATQLITVTYTNTLQERLYRDESFEAPTKRGLNAHRLGKNG